ncbi:MAG: CHASE3 domain-containing protein, partial [Saprospiraceae bacterium]|nr:CHASE3 domain-containing protein [Pyrinomonadaceae bacterium]
MFLKFERKLPIILFFVFLMLTTIGFLFYQNTISIQEAIKWEKSAQEVLSKLDETLTLALVIESSTSNFIVTGNETYLDPYNRAKPKINQNIATLRQLIPENPRQTAEIDRVEQLLGEIVTEAERRIALRKSEGFDIAVLELPKQRGKVPVDGVRDAIDRLKNEELRTLQEREQGLDISLNRTIWILIISSFAGIVFLGLANLVVLFENRKRRVAERALIDANYGLEQKVELRTQELQNVNETLNEVGTERETLLLNEQKARQDAEIANRLRDEFMATVSHELRTPLNSILGWARLMKGGTLDEAQSAKAVTTIIKNSETQNRLIEDLLDVARIISGKSELVIVEVDPVEIISHAIESAKPSADAKNIFIDLKIDGSVEGGSINGDRDRLRQVFSNLLNNAIKFSPQNTEIEVGLDGRDDFAEITVRDSGMGISSEFLPLVFERFRQDKTVSTKNG